MSLDETSIESQQSSQHPIAALYQRSVLDPIVEVARTISHDFVKRPRHYRAVPENVAGILEGFRIRTGSNPEWLSATQRAHLFSPIFGAVFCSTSIGLRSASLAFAERGAEMEPDLLDGVRDAAVAFRGYLKAIEGRAVSSADSETGPVFRCAIEVLQNEAVAGAFGLPPAAGGNWPLDGALKADVASSDGAYLIEEIQRALDLFYIRPTMTQHRFTVLQRVAHYGAMTIGGVFDEAAGCDSADQVHALVRNAYGWEKALQALLADIDVVRAWKDPQYRQNLSPCEKGMMAPHPSGEVDLKGTQLDPAAARPRMIGFSTMTLRAICCSTGDLPCATIVDFSCSGQCA
jgi:mersacidin/lichenicidin family type 2 lantibiotic